MYAYMTDRLLDEFPIFYRCTHFFVSYPSIFSVVLRRAGTYIRLAWHCCGTYKKEDNSGGSNGARMRFSPEAKYGNNAVRTSTHEAAGYFCSLVGPFLDGLHP